ncbi:helix-turn-helix transcriptional regulator [Fructilactobacillus sanfranciscensis]|uniref:helix-turn-helix transcriptional regulator n=1 Tax=Fructilactobacillus sanfranciscensis TaxID=1625 RepID=UPI00111A35E5|nr:helix-turn-helix transcriptional regulator [Fructilactobacillus sanfranciscensis]MVF16006.1 XRE family transcriptional regulator [Fructilactobacillus sanfranciscensis]TNK95160.1 transcriptional regulator [Fructilactobacillus sanfranciscensis]TNK97092.1 transcriptional regulator [Fructilactobacillus sanfranciscensis]
MSKTQDLIKEYSKDPEFKKIYDEEASKTETALAVRSLRDKLGLSQVEFAKLVSKPPSTISRIETGEMNPSFQLLNEIADKTKRKMKISFV